MASYRDNPKVVSKFDRSKGSPREPARVTKPGTTAYTPGMQGKMTLADTNAPSIPPHTHTDRMPLGGNVSTVGWLPNSGGQHADVVHAHGAHGSDGIHRPEASTDAAQGQAHSASGGLHGKRSPRPAQTNEHGTTRREGGALMSDSIRQEKGTDSP